MTGALVLVAVLSSAVFAGLAAAALVGDLPRVTRPRRRRDARLARWLRQAGSPLRPSQLVVGSLLVAGVVGGLVASLTGLPAVAVVPAVTAGLLPSVALARQRLRRRIQVQAAWPDALRQLAAAVQAGRTLPQALRDLASSGPDALRPALEPLAGRTSALGFVPAMEILRDELADPLTDRIVEVLLVAREEGGRIVAEIVTDLADSAAADLRAAEEVETLALEGRINARAVFVLPWLVLVAITAQPGPFREFYRHPRGLVVVAVGALLSVVGLLLVGRMSRLPAEGRIAGHGEGP